MQYDAIIVGGGIAGASAAHALRAQGADRVLVLEREPRPGYHATGRSAATLCDLDLDPVIHRALVAGARFLRDPPPPLGPVLEPTGVVLVYDEPEWSAVVAAAPELAARGTELELVSPARLAAVAPGIGAVQAAGAVFLPGGGRIDVDALLAGMLRGVELRCGAGVSAVLREGGRTVGVVTPAGEVRGRWIVNAAGPWVGQVGALAGATPIAFAARRRTAVSLPAPVGRDCRRWPLVSFESRALYYAPEAGGLIASPMDEGESPPCDSRPELADVATALARLAQLAPALAPAAATGARAGLRTFAPDRRFVIGEDPRVPGFVWLAGQGVWGIEACAPLAALAASVVTGASVPAPDRAALAPDRFA